MQNTAKQNYPGSCQETRNEMETRKQVGLFYKAPKPTRGKSLINEWTRFYWQSIYTTSGSLRWVYYLPQWLTTSAV